MSLTVTIVWVLSF